MAASQIFHSMQMTTQFISITHQRKIIHISDTFKVSLTVDEQSHNIRKIIQLVYFQPLLKLFLTVYSLASSWQKGF